MSVVSALLGFLFVALIVTTAIAVHQYERREYHRISRLEKARETWAKMIGDNNG